MLMFQLEYIYYCILSLFSTNKIPAIVLESAQNVVTKRNVKMNDTRFVFVQVPRRRNPAVVAYRATESSNGEITIKYGVSFCHNNDRFDRSLGREIASGRLNRRPLTETVSWSPEDQKFGVVVTEAVRTLVNNAQTQIRSFYGRNQPEGTRAIADNDIELSLCDETGIYVSLTDSQS